MCKKLRHSLAGNSISDQAFVLEAGAHLLEQAIMQDRGGEKDSLGPQRNQG